MATAIVRDLTELVGANARRVATDLEAVTGRGIRATVDGEIVLVGSVRMMAEADHELPVEVKASVDQLQAEGRTTMVVTHGARVLGVIGVMDAPKAEARQTLDVLRESGIGELVLISGDNQAVADAVGRSVGIDRAMGGCCPRTRWCVAPHRRWSHHGDGGRRCERCPRDGQREPGHRDGRCRVGGRPGTADIALMADDLGRVPFMVRLSRATSRLIRQNLIAALAIVAFLVPASLLGLAMGPIVFIHEGSTILVVLNALRLLRFDHNRDHHGITHEDRPAGRAGSAAPRQELAGRTQTEMDGRVE